MNPIYDSFPFPSPDGFVSGMTMAGYFIHVAVTNHEELKPGGSHYDPEAKPKYAIVIAYPYEDKKLQVRREEHERFSCTEEDFKFLNSCPDLKGKPVYLTVDVNSWSTGSERHGVWYRFISGSMKRFDGQPLGALPAGKDKN
ncbi:hypothetical protein AOY57_17310 [Escherichia coli]|uniref:hypothetical protein n=1 Tax=Escherichia coli TaxID=562 RepID=UPI0019188437|nr:hypothetical protein [Escherichia coli]UMT23795.1 hypothetical protein AOY57_17310 [Escherichia coli]CAD6122372.1 Uncharacterised protein [Escherichia coli]